MKKTFLSLGLCALSVIGAQAQGSFLFNNLTQNAGAGSPVTIQGSGLYVGSDFSASFFYMAGTVTDLGVFTAGATYYGNPVDFFGTTANNQLEGAGFFDGGEPVVAGAPGVYTIMAVAFDGANYASSLTRGASTLFQVTLVQNGGATPANPSAGLQPFTVAPIPEPSTFALAGLGLASLLIFRRRK